MRGNELGGRRFTEPLERFEQHRTGVTKETKKQIKSLREETAAQQENGSFEILD